MRELKIVHQIFFEVNYDKSMLMFSIFSIFLAQIKPENTSYKCLLKK